MGVFDGIRILDFSRVLAGPYATAMLADQGAEVIKIEHPVRGDDARHLGPFRGDQSIYFTLLNRNKRSVALDLKSPESRAVLDRLLSGADVLVENFRPGVADRLGLGYEELHRRFPDLVYASVSGYGQWGEQTDQAAYDLNVQAASGLMHITGRPDGGPTRVGESLGDLWGGLTAAWAISAALLGRERGVARGQHVDISMFDAMLSLQVTALSQLNETGVSPSRVGNRHPVSTPFDSFAASDGTVVIAVATEPLWRRLCEAMEREDLLLHPDYLDDTLRTQHQEALHRQIEQWTCVQTAAQICERLGAFGVPVSRVQTLGEALESPSARSRAVVSTLEQPGLGDLRVVRQPVQFSESPNSALSAAPVIGADNERYGV